MTVALCTDSSSLLSPAAAAALDVDVVTVPVALDGEPVDDTVSLDDLYERLEAGAVATTAHPSPGAFASAYRRAAERGADAVLSIHVDARTSGTVAAAWSAAAASPIPARVVDTGTLSYGVAVCVRAARSVLAEDGLLVDAEEAARWTGAVIRTAFVARPRRPGRIPPSDDWTVLTYEAGIATPLSPASTAAESIARMTGLALESRMPVRIAVGHASRKLETAADDLAHRLVGADGVAGVERYRVGASVGAHTGPECFGLLWWPAGR